MNYSSDNNFHTFCSVSNVNIYNVIITLKSSSSLDPLPIFLFDNKKNYIFILKKFKLISLIKGYIDTEDLYSKLILNDKAG